jgi:O-antigen ligase
VEAPVVLAVVAALAAAAYLATVAEPAWFLSAGIVLSVFSGRWADLGVPVALDRVALLVGLAALLARVGPSRHRPPLRLGATHVVMVAAVAFALGSALWAHTLEDPHARFRLLDSFPVAAFVLFAVAPVAFGEAHQRRILLAALVALGAYLGVTALAEAAGVRALVVPKYILDPAFGFHADRARGPFVEAVANGVALFGCAAAAVLAARTWRSPRARRVAWGVALLCVAALPLTYTRAVWIGVLAGTVAVLVCVAELRRWAAPVLGGAAGALLLAVLVVPGLGTRLDERYHEQGPVWVRENTNAAALRMVAERPVAGVGWNRFVPASVDRFRVVGDAPPAAGVGEPAHNVYLSRAAELGLVGAALWLLAFLAGIGAAVVSPVPEELRPWRAALLALALCWGVVAALGPAEYAFPLLVLWTWAGLLRSRAAVPAP